MSAINIEKALFYDIETHRGLNWSQLPDPMKKAFINHNYDPQTYNTPEDHYSEIAGLYAEFSHVICVSVGYVDPITKEFKKTSIYGPDEIEILNKTATLFKHFQSAEYYLATWNGTTCDIPYMVKRYIINSIPVPDYINEFGQKPWESVHLDVMNLWKFGDYKRTSLEMVCASLGIPCKTDELGGSNLYTYDLNEMPWDTLKHYCEQDIESLYLVLEHILKYYDTSD